MDSKQQNWQELIIHNRQNDLHLWSVCQSSSFAFHTISIQHSRSPLSATMQKQQACSFNRTFHWRVYRYYDLYRHQIIYFVVSGPHYPVVRQVKKCQMFKGKPKNQRPRPYSSASQQDLKPTTVIYAESFSSAKTKWLVYQNIKQEGSIIMWKVGST